MDINFSRNLIKGKIAEVIFEQMIREEGKYTVVPFGYEHTMPTLAQYRNISEVPEVMDNIADAPDFALISEDKTKIYLVEVKYQQNLDSEKIKECSEKLLARWKSPWIFVATPNSFFCMPCSAVIKNNEMSPLSENWVIQERQAKYLKLMNEFKNKTA